MGGLGRLGKPSMGRSLLHSAWNDPDCQAAMGNGPGLSAPQALSSSSWKEQIQDDFTWYHLGK